MFLYYMYMYDKENEIMKYFVVFINDDIEMLVSFC